MSNKIICTYALAKSMHDKERDILDIFIPFILMILYESEKDGLKEREIKNNLYRSYDLNIPGLTLRTILNRAKELDYIIQEHENIFLTDKTNEINEFFELERDIERKNNELFVELKNFLNNKDIELTIEETSNLIMSLINSNLLSLTAYLGEEPDIVIYKNFSKKTIRYTLEFFELIEENQYYLFEILKDLIIGSIICTLVKKEKEDLESKMDNISVYLDSNIVFSVLGYHHPEISILVQELYDLLIENSFELCIFDFTVEEIRNVLNYYKSNINVYSNHFKVNSIFSRLKIMGITKTDTMKIIADIEEILNKKKIKVVDSNEIVDKISLDEDSIKSLSDYKKDTSASNIEHDLKAIKVIRKIRSGKKVKLEDSKAIFLTSDHKLTKFNFEQHHKNDSSINEVILDQMLTNLLWVKNPSVESNLPIQAVISMHSNNKFIEDDVWLKFSKILSNMKEEEVINQEDVSLLLLNDRFENRLLDYEGNVQDIDVSFVDELLEESKNDYEQMKKEIKSSKKELKEHKEEKQKVTKESNIGFKKIVDGIESKSNKFSNNCYKLSIITSIILFFWVTYFIWSRSWSSYFPWLLNVIAGASGPLLQKTFKVYDKIKKCAYKKKKEQMIQSLNHDSIEELKKIYR